MPLCLCKCVWACLCTCGPIFWSQFSLSTVLLLRLSCLYTVHQHSWPVTGNSPVSTSHLPAGVLGYRCLPPQHLEVLPTESSPQAQAISYALEFKTISKKWKRKSKAWRWYINGKKQNKQQQQKPSTFHSSSLAITETQWKPVWSWPTTSIVWGRQE